MKKQVRQGLALVLALALCLTGCATSPKNDESAMLSSYEESKVLLPEGAMAVLDVKYLENGDLRIATIDSEYRNITVSDSVDGKWEASFTTERAASSLSNDMAIEAAALTDKGQLLCSFVNSDGSGGSFRLIGRESDEEVDLDIKRTPINSDNSASFNGVVGMRFLDDGGVYVVETAGSLSKYDIETGEKKFEVEIGQNDGLLADYALCGDQVIITLAHVDNDRVSFELAAFSATTGKREQIDASFEHATADSLAKDASLMEQVAPPLLANSAGGLLLCSKGKMAQYDNGETTELFGGGTNLENTNMSPARLFVKPDTDDVLVLYASSNSIALYRYERVGDDDTVGEPKEEISVYCLEDNPEVMQAVANFREKRTDVSINVTVGIPANSGISSDDAIRSLNAMLLSEDCPDVLVLDGLPIEQLAGQGVLVDLSGTREETLGSDQYFDNVLNAFGDTSWCVIPTRFTLPVVLGNTDMVAGFDSLDSLVGMLESDEQVRSYLGPASSIPAVYAAEYQNIVNDGSLDQAALSNFFYNSKKLLEIAEDNLSEDAKANGASPSDYALRGLDKLEGSIGRSEALISGTYRFEIGSIVDPIDFGYLHLATQKAEYESAYSALRLSADQAFVPNTMLGVCSKSTDVETSKDFVSYVLSSESQSQSQGSGLPVNKSAFEKTLRETNGYGLGFVGEETKNYTIEALSDSEVADCSNLVMSARFSATLDKMTTETISEAFESYCRGASSLEQSVLNAVDKVNLYNKQ